MALTPVSAVSEILRVINNQNRSTEAFLWLQETIREIRGVGRWQFLLQDRIVPFKQYIALPSDLDEIQEPVLLDDSLSYTGVDYLKTSDTTPTLTGSCPSGTTTVTVTVNSVDYVATVSGTAWTAAVTNALTDGTTYTVTATTDASVTNYTKNQLVIDSTVTTPVTHPWAEPLNPWEEEDVFLLKAQKGDYRLDPDYFVMHTRWTRGVLRLRYYRQILVPTSASSTTAIDLPEEFVYRLCVYGAARHGLIGEDDYDRLTAAQGVYQNALNEMQQKDARRKLANVGQILGGNRLERENLSPFPNTFAL
jgi:hypothetical protein